MTKRDLIIVMSVALLWGPTALLGQAHQHQRQGQQPAPAQEMMRMGQGHGMMMMALPSPGMILRQKEALGLSEAQVEKLEALQKQLDGVHKSHMEKAHPLHTEATAALHADKPDLANYESALQKLAQEHVKMQVEMARFSAQAMEALTAEQRSNVHYGMKLMHGTMGGMMQQGGMMGSGCPMMGPTEGQSH